MKSMQIAGAAFALAAAFAFNTAPAQARVVCRDVQVVHQVPHKDKHRVAGTAIGAVAGGLLGHQVGKGKGKTLATVGGAVAGGAIGHHVQTEHQKHDTYTTVERRCDEVQD
ncbi:MAG TPA: glycine zipper 2TM domain-containing protein [Rhodanobacteraceae bacterium]|nr:glycine zipper 2TM domain-containing protein [Rhodanobacteraceae bacterium]